jgi:hypothetical protein
LSSSISPPRDRSYHIYICCPNLLNRDSKVILCFSYYTEAPTYCTTKAAEYYTSKATEYYTIPYAASSYFTALKYYSAPNLSTFTKALEYYNKTCVAPAS